MSQIPFYKHIENITQKELESVKLEKFTKDEDTFYNLIIEARNSHSGSCNIIVLTEKQKNQFLELLNTKR